MSERRVLVIIFGCVRHSVCGAVFRPLSGCAARNSLQRQSPQSTLPIVHLAAERAIWLTPVAPPNRGAPNLGPADATGLFFRLGELVASLLDVAAALARGRQGTRCPPLRAPTE
jgi:hypothetical protein